MSFFPEYPIEGLSPAKYNPRRIAPDAFSDLQRSITVVGMAKPIIVNGETNTIVAGHQRLKAMRSLGWITAPIFLLESVSVADEMAFNQLHNGTDLDTGDEAVRVPPSTTLGYADVEADLVTGNQRSAGAPIRSEIIQLVMKHGPWGGIVATQSGECISGAQYGLSCKQIGYPVRVYYVEDVHAPLVKAMFQKPYGEFYYEGLARETYAQTYAQPRRLRKDRAGNADGGSTHVNYERFVYPVVTKETRILDFGCGYGESVRELQKQGYNIRGMEFFRRFGDSRVIDTDAVHAMIDELCADIAVNGLYDFVLADYVLNSVDSVEAEDDVCQCVQALTRLGGRMLVSGRRREYVDNAKYKKMFRGGMREIEFFDAHGFTVVQMNGLWLYQLYHNRGQVRTLAQRFFTKAVAEPNYLHTENPGQWQLRCMKDGTVVNSQADIEASLAREFNMVWPNEQRVGRSEQIVAAYRQAFAIEAART